MKRYFKRTLIKAMTGALVLTSFALITNNRNVKAASGSVLIGDIELTSGNSTSSGGGTATYTETSTLAKLVFNNYSYVGTPNSADSNKASMLQYNGTLPLEIEVNGTNKIQDDKTDTDNYHCYGLRIEASGIDVTFTGSGSLNLRAGNAMLSSYGFINGESKATSINFNGPNLTFEAGTTSVSWSGRISNAGLYIEKATVNFNKGQVVANGGTNNGTTADGGESYGFVDAFGAKVNVNGGALEANGGVSAASSSYGLYNYGTFKINSGASSVKLTGNTKALACYAITNQIAGRGYSTISATSYDTIPAGTTSESDYKKIIFQNEIKATVTGYEGLYDGNSHTLTATVSQPTEYTIKYGTTEGTYNLTTAPSYTEGTHTVYYQITSPGLDAVSGSVVIRIYRENPNYTAPTAKTGLKYKGKAQELVNAGALGTGATSIEYKLGEDGTYSTSIPKATTPGTYTVYYKVVGDSTHETLTDLGPISVTISKADIQNVKVTVSGTYNYNGELQTPAISRMSSTFGDQNMTWTYSTSQNGTYTSTLPSFKNPGEHVIYFKITADYHNDYNGSFVFVINALDMPDSVNTTPITSEFTYNKGNIIYGVTENGELPTSDTLTFSYSLEENGEYNTLLPTLCDAGKYVIYWKAEANGYNTKTGSFTIIIHKLDSVYTQEPQAITGLVYTRENYELITAGSSECGDVAYALSLDDNFTTTIPMGMNVGEYTIYYRILGSKNYNESEILNVKVVIAENDKTNLKATLAEAISFYNTIKTGYPNVAATLNAVIEEAQGINDNKNVLVSEITSMNEELQRALLQARDDSRDIVNDENTGVTIITGDGTGIPTNIDLVVEKSVEVSAEKGSVEYKNIKKNISKKYDINNVYTIKLVKTVDGQEVELQPSDIKDGMTVIVRIAVPEDLKTKGLKILQVNDENNMEYIKDFEVENGEIVFETSTLSEILLLEKDDAMPVWAIALITTLLSILLVFGIAYLLLFFVFNKWINKDGKARRVIKLGKKDNNQRVMLMSFRMDNKPIDEVYNTKEEALK